MNAEELLKYFKGCVETLNDGENFDNEVTILPTTGDPMAIQDDVSFIIMTKTDEGRIPKFIVRVEDLEAQRKKEKWQKQE